MCDKKMCRNFPRADPPGTPPEISGKTVIPEGYTSCGEEIFEQILGQKMPEISPIFRRNFAEKIREKTLFSPEDLDFILEKKCEISPRAPAAGRKFSPPKSWGCY